MKPIAAEPRSGLEFRLWRDSCAHSLAPRESGRDGYAATLPHLRGQLPQRPHGGPCEQRTAH
eukprot:5625026-Pyramimonas_sp.AAC.1